MTHSIKVRTDRMESLAEVHNLTPAGMAERIGVTEQTYKRAMSGENVSAAFVAGATLAFGIDFAALFTSVSAPQTNAA